MKVSAKQEQILLMVKDRQITPEEGLRQYYETEKDEHNQPSSHQLPKQVYFQYKWIKPRQSNVNERSWEDLLVFDHDNQIVESLKKALQNYGGRHNIALVKPGMSFGITGDYEYEIRPGNRDDALKLVNELNNKGFFADKIAYLWSYNAPSKSNDLQMQLNLGIYSLVELTKALLEKKIHKPTNLLYIYQAFEDEVSACDAAISGFAKSIMLENPKCKFKILEMRRTIKTNEKQNDNHLKDAILREFQTEYDGLEVRYHNGKRLVKQFVESELSIMDGENKLLRDSGVYLITGGTGGLGMIFARHLARKVKARLVLTGRSRTTEEIHRKINELKSLGADVMYIEADVARLNDVEDIIGKVREHWGGINGIIHCAGVIKDAYLFNKTAEDFKAVLAPKVWGTVNLDVATEKERMDFFVLCSSFTAVTGNLGQCDYAYANSFMDNFAKARNQCVMNGERVGKTVSFNWPLWRGGGMTVDRHVEEFLINTMGINTLDPDLGLDIFENGLSFFGDQFIAIDGNSKKIKRFLNAGQNSDEYINPGEQPGLNADGDRSFKAFQNQLLEIACRILDVKEGSVDLDADMHEFGFESISYTQFANVINQNYELDITPAVFFEHVCIRSFSELLWNDFEEQLTRLFPAEEAIIAKTGAEASYQATQSSQRFAENVHYSEESSSLDEPVAIVGMSGKMPGSENMEVFWKHLEEGRDLISEIPENRWDWTLYYGEPDEEENKTKIKWGGFMNEVAGFDAAFFGISPREADLMDPRQRLWLETVWKTIEDAGYKASDLSGTKTGVFVGVAYNDYEELLKDSSTLIEAHSSTGTANSILANRISYILNLRGPSEPVDTACSSSLVAIHKGVEAIRNGSCEMVIAGGVNIILSPWLYISFNKAGMLSPDGRCKSFDHRADGYVRGEGVGAVLLKSLRQAEADGDYIYGIIRGSAINHGGRANSLTAPNPNAQAELLIDAYRGAGVDFNTISYIECHGTGTKLGDPVEINGLKKAFNELSNQDGEIAKSCGLGSVKTNIGHLEAAAGMAGLFKVLLSFKYEKMPPSINFEKLNPFIDLEETPFYIVEELRPWKRLRRKDLHSVPRRAGISSFGFGGVNAHLIIEEYDNQVHSPKLEYPDQHVIILSSKTEEGLRSYANELLEFLDREAAGSAERIANIAYTLQLGRVAMNQRLAVVVSSMEELREKLELYCEGHLMVENLFTGSATEAAHGMKLLVEGRAGKEFIKAVINDRELPKLAHLWVSGIDIDWNLLYPEGKPRRIPLSTYPFAGEHHWVNLSRKYQPEQERHENSALKLPAFSGQFYSPAWKYEPLTENSIDSISSGERKARDKNVLIIHPSECLGLDKGLEDLHGGENVTHLILSNKTVRLSEKSWEIRAQDSNALDSAIRQIEGIGTIYFLGGINSNQVDTDDMKLPEQSQELGVISLFRLIKSLNRNGLAEGTITIKVITNNVHQVFPEEWTNPYSAGLIGLTGAIAMEYPELLVSCIDIDLEPVSLSRQGIHCILHDIVAEPCHPEGREVAYRGGRRYVKIIEPVVLAPAEETPFRSRGVYFILGGTGGLGLEVSHHLAKTVQARLVLVGRNELTEEKKIKIQEIESIGGQVLYIKADATDSGSMKNAYQKAKSEYGCINGVIHSAMVPKFGILESISESDFIAGLLPKTRGSVVLHNVFKNEPIDFMLFFSSFAAFSGYIKYGASNYVAGITFSDTFAGMINQKVSYPVKTINWGYFGNIGSGAKNGLEEIFSEWGLMPIDVGEGMESMRRVLENSYSQVIVIKAEERFLQKSGVRLDCIKFQCPKTNPSLTEGAMRRVLPLLSETESLLEHKLGFKEFDWYARCLILGSFQNVGVFKSPGEKYDRTSLKDEMRIKPYYYRLFECLIDIFEESGFIKITDDFIITARGIDGEDTIEVLQNKEGFGELLLRKVPELEPYVKVLQACAETYGEIITGQNLATDVLFPGSSMELMEGIYKGNMFSDFFNRLVAASIRSYVEERIPLLQEGEKIKILEVGAGTGGTSEPVLEAIKPFENHMIYLYTDISQAFIRYGKNKYGPRYSCVEFGVLDLERDVTAQGYASGDFDIILGANVVHATKRLRNTLQSLKMLLKTNGWLVLNEATGVPAWGTMIFGLLDGWWLFEDEERLKGCPLLSSDMWNTVLREEGFRNVTALGAHKIVDGELPQHVIIAESDGTNRIKTNATKNIYDGLSEAMIEKGHDQLEGKQVGNGIGPDVTLAAKHNSLPYDTPLVRQSVEKKIIKVVAQVLQLDQGLVDPELPYAEFGLDSIFAAEIVSHLNRLFPVKINTNDFLRPGTIRAFSVLISTKIEPEVILEEIDDVSNNRQIDDGQLDKKIQISSVLVNHDPQAHAGNGLSHSTHNEPVAIIGMNGVMPGSDSLESFWLGLIEGKSFISKIPEERWSWKSYYGDPVSETNKTNSIWGGFLNDVRMFDAMFFGISPREAKLMDPQHRIFLETVWKTIECAGYRASDLAGTKTGVFVGVGTADYAELLQTGGVPADPVAMIGVSPAMLANRISYYYDFQGPSESINTTCSGSAVAVHRAVNAIRSGECEMAIAGGVSLVLSPTGYISLDKAGILSRSGTVRPFDQKADGFIRGEGAGAVLLKSLSRAEEDGDHIYALIKGSAVSHGGRNNVSMVSPSIEAQSRAIIEAHKDGGIEPGTVNYIESHGTGSPDGDKVELRAYQKAFETINRLTEGRQQLLKYCGIGSYKPSVGHLEAASGICAIIKVVLALRDKVLPATLNFEEINKNIDIKDGPFFIVNKTMKWEPMTDCDGRDIPRRAGIHSFGFGGTNAHLIMEEYSANMDQSFLSRENDGDLPNILVFSAKTEKALREHLKNMNDFFKKARGVRLQDVAYTLQVGRDAMKERLAIVVRSVNEAVETLDGVLNNEIPKNAYRGSVKPKTEVIGEGAEESNPGNEVNYLEMVGKQWVCGADVNWNSMKEGRICKRISLPTYPFTGERYWFDQIWTNGSPISKSSIDLPFCQEVISGNNSYRDKQIEQQIKEMISELVEIPCEVIKPNENLKIYGFNSLMAVKLSNQIRETFGIAISLKNILIHLTLVELSQLIMHSGALTEKESNSGMCVGKACSMSGGEIDQGVQDIEDGLYDFIIDELVAGRLTPKKAAELAGSLRKSG